ncbi:MAG: glycosyltransferase family 1 protein [Actinobacteria bacterium]|nr:glycosyltransferase family 1 protein [Actinomycetota bacterium]
MNTETTRTQDAQRRHPTRRRIGEGRDSYRIAIVAESFLPQVNGVTNSVLRVTEHMSSRGHTVEIIAPSPGDEEYEGSRVHRLPSLGVPGYDGLRVGRSMDAVRDALRDIRPDVVHVASPVVLGAAGIRAAREIGVPTVAVYQTDLPGFAARYHLGAASRLLWRGVAKLHKSADVTLAPSTAAVWDLRQRGVDNVVRWMRGVDLDRFNPSHRCEKVRTSLSPHGEVIVGYVGRLAREKQVERLKDVASMPNVKLVVVGDGPMRKSLEAMMPNAVFTGFKSGEELSKLYASFDLFVHTGVDETFCQSVQEALASGVPVIAPAAGGPLDLVLHGVNGYLWTEKSTKSLLGAVCELVDHPVKRERLADAARPSVEQRTWSAIMDELEGHYRSVVSGLGFAYRSMP